MLQGKIDRLIDIGTWYGMEMNVDKTTILSTDYVGSKKTVECGIFQLFGLLGAIRLFTSETESVNFCDKSRIQQEEDALFLQVGIKI